MRNNLRATTLALGTAFLVAACGGDTVESLNPTPPSRSAGYTQVIAFGDSLSDAGTYNPTTADTIPSNDSATGFMFTTKPGGTWATYVAANLGIPLTPRQQVNFGVIGHGGEVIQLQGTGYAEGGAKIEQDDGTGGITTENSYQIQLATQRSIKTQIDAYLAEHGNSFNERQLVLIQGGANDFFAFFKETAVGDIPSRGPLFVQETVTAMVTQIGRLKAAGARHVLYSNLPDLGKTPLFTSMGPVAAAAATQLSVAYNAAVKQQTDAMGVATFDTFSLIDQVVASPVTYGFTDATNPVCTSYEPGKPPSLATVSALFCSPTTLAGDPYRYVFADAVHPTTHAQVIWADLVTTQYVLAGKV